MQKLLLIATLTHSLSLSYSQEIISVQGNSYTNTNGSVDFTLGEVVINTEMNGLNQLTQGFHQTMWNILGVEDQEQNFDASVYPNPLGNELFVESENFENVVTFMYDATGRLIAKIELNSLKTSIDVSKISPGSYTLILRNENQEKIKAFKLVKTH